ncbi:MAG TPA: DUF3488 and transglutaminase-like domain-containing protein [Rhodanobacteraceae bacterium]|nr:DUF3488 and transglutaminase-like domain-containing protein [Rhodanobacteraceae bacterium]
MTRLDRHAFDLLGLTVAGAVAVHMAHLPVWLDLAMLALLAVRWLQRRLRPDWGGFPWWVRLPLTLALPLAIIAQYGNLFGRDPGSALAAGMLVLKLSESERPRDARSAVTFASFLLMAALLFDQSLAGTLLVALGLVPPFATLRALERDEDSEAGFALARRDLAGAGLLLLAALPLGLTAFLFLPRLSSPLWGAPGQAQERTGVGDDMSPGSLTDLLIDDSPAFRVSFDAGAPPRADQRYWRGKVLWDYDGAVWRGQGSGPLGTGEQPLQRRSAPLRYEVALEPTRQRKLFVLDMPLAAPEGARLDRDFTLSVGRPIEELRTYRAEAVLDYRLEGLTPAWRRQALELPPGFNPRAQALARSWRSAAHEDMDVVRAALTLFHDRFSYTLSAPPLGRDAMDDFLFDTRAGFCEHYASAFTVLMRAAGIPARVVIGYQGGYWNDFGRYLVVRQSDAHAWSEIWLDDRGWVRVDPTAAISPQRVQLGAQAANGADKPWYGAGWWLTLRNRWDLANRLWNNAVLRFDSLRQGRLLQPFGVDRAGLRELGLALLLSSGLVIGAALAWALRRERARGDALDRAWARLGRALARRGLPRATSEGPQDYIARAVSTWPQARAELQNLGRRYVTLRYACIQAAPADVEEFSRAVRNYLSRARALPPAAATTPRRVPSS